MSDTSKKPRHVGAPPQRPQHTGVARFDAAWEHLADQLQGRLRPAAPEEGNR